MKNNMLFETFNSIKESFNCVYFQLDYNTIELYIFIGLEYN
jgi:hypothetical protein